jgi:hypothetical protein
VSVYLVVCELRSGGQQAASLSKALSSSIATLRLHPSVWLTESGESAQDMERRLSGCIQAGDSIFIARLEGEAAWEGLPVDHDDRIKELLLRGTT